MDWWESYYLFFIFGNISIVLLFLSFFFPEKYKNILSILILLNLSLIISIRNKDVALDSDKYATLFINGDVSNFFQDSVSEIGFIILNLLIRLYTSNYHIYFFFISLIHVFLILLLYKKLEPKYFPILLALYISTFVFWLSNISMLRQSLAIPLISLGLYFLVFENNLRFFFLSAIISSSIHFSSIPVSLFIIIFYFFYKSKSIFALKVFTLLLIMLILYPENLFADIIIYILHLISSNSLYFIKKIEWYFTWNKLFLWKVKHVYYLIIFLFFLSSILFKDKKVLLLILIPLSILAFFKFDEMVTDRIFMYFIPFIPYVILKFSQRIFYKVNYNILYIMLLFGILLWFNVKLMYLQYQGWFIYPYPSVR